MSKEIGNGLMSLGCLILLIPIAMVLVGIFLGVVVAMFQAIF